VNVPPVFGLMGLMQAEAPVAAECLFASREISSNFLGLTRNRTDCSMTFAIERAS
jgi:hypothetical protein